ncbi:hypothetical protein CCACVL1_14821 [Corchorus capsularis]|uniref:Uncharacterized protein n=1 Tax=Corchorus capsularis TaxID=210143 RepID=A0A1R3I5D4_COCAP|nr:hypothetical protein CCACVL1_14821 [Corchorus capsularis]
MASGIPLALNASIKEMMEE